LGLVNTFQVQRNVMFPSICTAVGSVSIGFRTILCSEVSYAALESQNPNLGIWAAEFCVKWNPVLDHRMKEQTERADVEEPEGLEVKHKEQTRYSQSMSECRNLYYGVITSVPLYIPKYKAAVWL